LAWGALVLSIGAVVGGFVGWLILRARRDPDEAEFGPGL
jgi:hypothetical protein